MVVDEQPYDTAPKQLCAYANHGDRFWRREYLPKNRRTGASFAGEFIRLDVIIKRLDEVISELELHDPAYPHLLKLLDELDNG